MIVPAPNVPKLMRHQADRGPKVDSFKGNRVPLVTAAVVGGEARELTT